MLDRENAIRMLRIERECVSRDCDRDCAKCDLAQDRELLLKAYDDALELLKEQEPRLVVKDDFENADKYGYLPVYVENRDGDMYWDCITDAALGDTVSRFWTAKPTDEQRKAVKWDA